MFTPHPPPPPPPRLFGDVHVAYRFSFQGCGFIILVFFVLCPMLAVWMDCQFLIASAPFSNVYDDDDVSIFLLDQHTLLNFYSASSLKNRTRSTDRHVAAH
jgi:hypothetical protein